MDITQFLDNFNGGTRQNRFVIEFETKLGPASGLPAGSQTTGTGKTGTPSTVIDAVRSPNYSPAAIGSFPIHVRATKTPELTMGIIPVNYRGKTVSFPGDRPLNNWEFVVIDDVSKTSAPNQHLHRAFMDWSRAISPTDARLGVVNFDDATGWKEFTDSSICKITQLDHSQLTDANDSKQSNINRAIRLYNCWPKEVGPLQFDMSTDNAINYFRVVMAYAFMDGHDTSSGTDDWP